MSGPEESSSGAQAAGQGPQREDVSFLASFPVLNPNPVVEIDFEGHVHYANPAAQRLVPDLAQRGAGHRFLTNWPGVVDLCRRGGELPIREVLVGDRWYQQSMYFVPGPNRVRIFGLDVTDRKLAEEALRQRSDELAAINALSRSVSETLSQEQVTAAAMEGILNAVHPTVAFLFLREGQRLILKALLPKPFRIPLDAVPEHRVGQCMCGLTVLENKPLYSTNIFQDFRCTWDECKKAGIKSFASLPLRDGEEVVGVIGVGSETERDFERESNFLDTLAGQVSIAFKNARLFESAQQELADRKRVEDALRESEEKFRHVFSDAPVGIVLTSPQGVMQQVNPAFCAFLGYSQKELQGKTIKDITHPDDWHASIDAIRGAQPAGQAVRRWEKRYIHKNRRVLWGEVSISMVAEVQGKPGFIIAQVLDITARKRNEDALRVSEEQLKQAARVAGLGIFDHDQMTDKIHWSLEMREICGWEPMTEAGLSEWISLIHPEDRAGIAEAIKLAHNPAGDGRYSVEHRILRHDGGLRWVSVRSQTFFEGEGAARHPVRTIGATLDITDRKLAEQAIQRSEQRLRAVFDNAGVGILEADSKDRFIAANPRVCEILDYDRQELVGMSVHELTAPEDRPRSDELNAQLHEGRFGRFDTDKRYLRPDGTALWLHVTVSGVRDLAGRHAGAIATIEDISGRKQAEDALRALNVTLEERVAERTAVAEHRAAQLRELASMLTQTEQKERRRVAHILHEHFQQLLFAVQLQLGQLKGQLKDKNMTDIADKAEHILAEGIDVSRTLAVEMYPPVLYSLGLLPALDWLAAKMKDKYGLGVKVTADPEAEPVTDASKTLLFDSTSELLFNVVKHAKVKTAGVTVKRLGDRVEITVADKGVGFDPAMLPEREGAAGGFGLFSIRERLDVMGGRLEIESAPGQGSRFRITAPVGETPPVQVEALLPTVPAATSGVTAALGSNGAAVVAQRKIRVMLVDDHAIVRQGISLALKEAQDIEVAAEAADGSIAVDIVHKILPDVVLMDISMPVMDGIEATRIIHQQHPDVRIIGLSMFEESEQSAAMRKAGACAYLTKSGDFNALLATIRTWSPVPAGNAANQREEK